MSDTDKSKDELIQELTELRRKITEKEPSASLGKYQLLEEELKNYRYHFKKLVRIRTSDLITINQKLQDEIIERRRIEQKLRQNTEQLSMVLDNLPIVPYTLNAKENFAINYVADTIEKISGYPPALFIEDRNFWAGHIHPEDREKTLADLSKIIGKGTHNSSYRFLIADGTYRWFTDVRRLIMSKENEISHIAGTWQDITEEIMLRQESEYRRRQILQADKLASLGEVVAGVAHEINNPNSFITYNIPILEETWGIFRPILEEYGEAYLRNTGSELSMEELGRDMDEIIQAIKIGSDRISKVVTDLKDFVRRDEGFPAKPVQINEVINRALTIVGSQLKKSVSEIQTVFAEDLPNIQGNFHRIEQVVANLLLNAAHAIPSTRDAGKITITTRHIKRLNSIIIQVEDNGIGMSPEVLARIFEPFFTSRREAGGTGLGLSVSFGLIKEQNGAIAVLSRPDRGTRFTVFLPMDRRDANLDLRPTILCVDDEETSLDMLRIFFGRVENIAYEMSSNPENVLAYLKEYPEVDIVLTDINMPGINGWELLEKIKAEFPLLPVILYSGDPSSMQSPKPGLQPDSMLEKPFGLKKLVEIINGIGRQRF